MLTPCEDGRVKVLFVNKFFYERGGAVAVFFDTARLIESFGHKAILFAMSHPQNLRSPYSRYFVSNVDFDEPGPLFERIKAAGRILYSLEAKRKIDALLKNERPHIVHLHNIYHQISPSILHTIKAHGLPIVMTLHDYKMVCPTYNMLTNGKPCERCRRGRFYWCLIKRCNRRSLLRSAVNVLEMYLHHRILHIYDLVDVFISPSLFLKEKVQEMGFEGEIHYLPNFIEPGKFLPCYDYGEKSLVYFGRLSPEKGLFTLLEAVGGLDMKLKIIGDGPLRKDLEMLVSQKGLDNVSFLGYKGGEELKGEIQKAVAVVLPSRWYENSPRSIIEAFALGKPVIGSRIGGIPELVRDGETGLTFEPGNAQDLRAKIKEILTNPDRVVEMGKKARGFVEEELNAQKHYKALMEIYNRAMSHRA